MIKTNSIRFIMNNRLHYSFLFNPFSKLLVFCFCNLEYQRLFDEMYRVYNALGICKTFYAKILYSKFHNELFIVLIYTRTFSKTSS